MYEARNGLHSRPEHPPKISTFLKSERRFGRRVSDAFRDFQGNVIEQVDVFNVVDYVCVPRLEPKRNQVESIVVTHPTGFIEFTFIIHQEFLVISHLKVQSCIKRVLQVFSENPWNEMPDMNWPRRASPSVQHEPCSLFVKFQNRVQIPVRKEQTSPQLKMNLTRVLCQFSKQLVCQGLSPKLAYQTFIVDPSLDLPGSNNHLILFLITHT